MKAAWTILFFLGAVSLHVAAQDIAESITRLDSLLRTRKLSVNDILSDEKWMYLHAKTPFRNLVKAHAPVGSISIVTPAEPGTRIKLRGHVTDKEGIPFAGALVYAYQTSARGWYADTGVHIQAYEGDMRHARLFGYVITDKDGNFEIETIQPSGYPESDLPAHIHIAMWKHNQWVPGVPGELLFEEDKRLTPERKERALREGYLIAANSGSKNAPVYFYPITLK